MAQEVAEARDFVKETMRNAWVPEDMKRKIEKHVARLCDIVECQERSLQDMTDKLVKVRGEYIEKRSMIDSILFLNLDHERIDTTPGMCKLTKQCIDAYNTCLAIKDMAGKDAESKVYKVAEKIKRRDEK